MKVKWSMEKNKALESLRQTSKYTKDNGAKIKNTAAELSQ